MQMKLEAAWLQDFARRYTGAWCSQEASRVAEFFALNGSLSVNGAPNVGRGAITKVAQGFMSAFPDMKLTMDDVRVRGDGAVYRWTFMGTNTGPGGTGNRVRFSGYEEWKFEEDGLIAESQGHFDAADYQRQMEKEN
jgi:uncharacterized protein (TIGR02246 family)